MSNKTRLAVALSAALALTASTGMIAAAQDDEMAEGGLICVIVPPLNLSLIHISEPTRPKR